MNRFGKSFGGKRKQKKSLRESPPRVKKRSEKLRKGELTDHRVWLVVPLKRREREVRTLNRAVCKRTQDGSAS